MRKKILLPADYAGRAKTRHLLGMIYNWFRSHRNSSNQKAVRQSYSKPPLPAKEPGGLFVDEYIPMGLTEQLKFIRNRAGLSQSELGKKLGVSHAAISDIERGKTDVSLWTVDRWVSHCGYDFTWNIRNPKL